MTIVMPSPRFGAMNLVHLSATPTPTLQQEKPLEQVVLAVELTGRHAREFKGLLPKAQQSARPVIQFHVAANNVTGDRTNYPDTTPWRTLLEEADSRMQENPPVFAEDDPRIRILNLARRFVDKLPVHFQVKDFLARHIAAQAKARSFCGMEVLKGRYFETEFIPTKDCATHEHHA